MKRPEHGWKLSRSLFEQSFLQTVLTNYSNVLVEGRKAKVDQGEGARTQMSTYFRQALTLISRRFYEVAL